MRSRDSEVPENDAFRAEEWGLGTRKTEKAGLRPHGFTDPKWSPTLSSYD